MSRPTTRSAHLSPLGSRLVATVMTAVVLGAAGALVSVTEQRAPQGPPAVQLTAARAANPVTPGDFTGLGFDQCLAPTQAKMDAWLQSSPFLAVGIYISGASRGCRSQPNLTPTWVSTQLRNGWRLLPITLGPQASCSASFPRYGNDPTINPKPGRYGKYGEARTQGRDEAVSAVAAATKLGLAPGSTLYYDLEGFSTSSTTCRESALHFLSAWTKQLHASGWKSGVYSSAGSGIAVLDEARVERPSTFTMPDHIWIARWDGQANTTTSYISDAGWNPGARIKQFQGGHNETWGGVTINIDRNYLDVGRGTVVAPEQHCSGVNLGLLDYPRITAPSGTSKPDPAAVRALQCLLSEKGLYQGRITGTYGAPTVAAARAWKQRTGRTSNAAWTRVNWMTLLIAGDQPVLKLGSTGPAVRRLQRTLNAASPKTQLRVTGAFTWSTTLAVRDWQKRQGWTVSGVASTNVQRQLAAGNR